MFYKIIINRRFIILFQLLVLFKIKSFAQTSDTPYNKSYIKKNAVNLVIGGECGVVGANYQRNFFFTNYVFQSVSLGFGFPFELYKPSQTFIPLSYDVVIGKNSSKLQLGITALNIFDSKPSPNTKAEREKWLSDPTYRKNPYEPPYQMWFLPKVGYNYYGKRNFIFKAYWSPICYKYFESGRYAFWSGWGGLSVGYSFS